MIKIKNTLEFLKNMNHYNPISENSKKLFVKFLGVRGTHPTPSINCLKYGGNTSCLKVITPVNSGNVNLYLDAGTGIIQDSELAIKEGIRKFHVLLTHMHYDHIFGLCQFAPLFRTDCEIHFYGQSKYQKSLKNIFESFFSCPFFPLEFAKLPALKNMQFHDLSNETIVNVCGLPIEIFSLNHPQQAIAYKIFDENKLVNFVYATDHEHGTSKDIEFKQFIQNSNLLIYDSTFSDNDFKQHLGWGHSTSKAGATFSKESNVKNYAIFHYNPSYSDKYLEKNLLPEAKKIFKNSFLSREGKYIRIE